MKAVLATDLTLFDFKSASRPTGCKMFNDDVIGGASTSHFEVTQKGFAVFSGEIRLDNKGGFASVQFPLPRTPNLDGVTGFVVRVRGDGHRYRFGARDGPTFDTPLYQTSFTTAPGTWKDQKLAVNDLAPAFRGQILTDLPPLNPAQIGSVSFLISDQQAGPFRLEIAWIKALKARGQN